MSTGEMCLLSDATGGSDHSFSHSTRSWAAAVVELADKVFAGDAALAATGLAALADVCSGWSTDEGKGAPHGLHSNSIRAAFLPPFDGKGESPCAPPFAIFTCSRLVQGSNLT